MLFRLGFLLFLCVSLFACSAPADPASKIYEHGDIRVRLPDNWKPQWIEIPGVRLLHIREDIGDPDSAADLFWLESTPLTKTNLKDLVSSVSASVGLEDLRVRSEKLGNDTYEV